MKKTLILLACLTGAIATLLYASWLYLNSSFFADIISRKCQEFTGSSLKFKKNPSLALFPPSLSMEEISWSSEEKSLDIKFKADILRIYIDLSSLLHDQFHIREIFAHEANLEILDKSAPGPQDSGTGMEKTQSGVSLDKLPFLLDRVVLRNSSFSYDGADLSLRLSRMNLSAENFGPRQETDVKCDFHLAAGSGTGEKARNDMAGNMAIRAKLRYYAPNLTFRQTALTFTATEGQLLAMLSPMSLEAEGSANLKDFSLRINSSLLRTPVSQVTLKGDYTAPENTFQGHVSLDYNPVQSSRQLENAEQKANYSIIFASPVQYRDNTLSFPDIAISSGGSKGSGTLRYVFSTLGQSPSLSGKISFCALNLPKKKRDDRNPPKSSPDTRKNRSEKTFVWPDVDISISAPAINYDRFSSQDIHFRIQGSAGEYDLKNLRFLWASGKAEGSGHVNMRDSLLMLRTNGRNMNIGRALWELGVNGFQGGLASFESALAFSGFDASSLRKSLTGSFSFEARQVKVSLLEEMAAFLSKFSPKASLLPNGIDLFSVEAHAENGSIELDPLLLESKDLKAEARGKIDLGTDRIDAQLSLKVFGMTLPVALNGLLSNPSWHIEPAWLKSIW